MLRKFDYRYIYIMANWAYPFRYKIGIARNVEKRKAGIDRSVRGNIIDLFWIRVLFAQRIEQFMHWLYAPLHAKMQGSGKTEWFWMIFPITPIFFLILVWLIQVLTIPTLIVAMIYALLNSANV